MSRVENQPEGGNYEVHLSESSQPQVFTKITEKVSTGLDQLAGMINEKVEGLKGEQGSSKLAEIGRRTAGLLNSSASYIRKADLEQMQSDLRATIKRNPERSLLVGLGVGILLGGILRKKG